MSSVAPPGATNPMTPPTMPQIPPPPPPPARAPLPPSPPPQVAKGLPADAPKLTIGGGVYSPNPKHRMAIINGQVVHEGAELAPGLVLEQITERDVVIAFRGARYRVLF